MMKNILFVSIALCLLASQLLAAQPQSERTSGKDAIIFRPNQEVTRGQILDIRGDSIIVFSFERELVFAFSEVSRIILTHERQLPRSGPLYGAIIGTYASLCMIAHSNGREGFLESDNTSSYLFAVVPAIGLGAGLGYLLEQGHSQEEELFDFTGGEEASSKARSRLVAAMGYESIARKVHVTVQGSHIYSRMPTLGSTSPYYSTNTKRSMFNMLRRAQLTYSVTPKLEAGAAVVWINEPSQGLYIPVESHYTDSSHSSRNANVSQTFSGTGKYAVALYRYLLAPQIELKVGGGIGMASVNFQRKTTLSSYAYSRGSGNSSSQRDWLDTVSENFFSGYVFGSLDAQLADGLSIGLVVDKVFVPSRGVPAVPAVNLPAETLHFDNASLGFTLSLHF